MYFEDLNVGMSKTLKPGIIDKDKMLAFAKEYDNVPLHTDEDYALGTRFGKLIAPGVISFIPESQFDGVLKPARNILMFKVDEHAYTQGKVHYKKNRWAKIQAIVQITAPNQEEMKKEVTLRRKDHKQ